MDYKMFKAMPSPQPRGGLGGSGALSHVYIESPPLRCSIPGAIGLYYDDANKLLLSPTSDQVFSWKTGLYPPLDVPISDSISDGPVLSIRYSLDGKVMGIQRSNQEIEFRNRETGASFKGRCRAESDNILGFFWTDCPTCDVVFIKASGLDLFSYEPELNMLRFVETKRLNVSWYSYTHESRLVLLASGMQCKNFTGFQFSSGGIIRLPKFEMTMAVAEVNKKPVLASEDVQIVTIYGRIYCLQVDRLAMQLHLYRFYRDAVVHQGSLPIYSIKIAISVVDNVLLVHQVDAKVVLLYDIFADSRAPISAPLPLLVRGLPSPNSSVTGSKQTVSSSQLEATSENEEVAIYGDDWTFLYPDLICDVSHGTLWRIRLDLEAIAASSSEVPSVLEFLQRRRLESNKAKQLCVGIMRSMILERRPVSMVARALDVIAISYSHSIKLGAPGIQTQGKFIRQDSNRRAENEAQESKPRDVENEPQSVNPVSSMNRLSSSSVSDSEENQNLEQLKTNSSKPSEASVSGSYHTPTAKGERKNHNDAEASHAITERIPLQSETLQANGNSVGSSVPDQRTSQHASVAISPDEMYSCVFSLVEEEMAGDPTYLVAVIVEYYRSAALERFKVHSSLHMMTIQLLARSERYAELGQFVINKILEPSKEVSLQLIESGRQNLQTRKLGMDMLRQLSYHDDYVSVLLQDGYYLEALRYVRKTKVNTIRPALFLEAAFASNDSQHLAAVLRFFSDYMPDFTSTSDYSNFCGVLNEMTQSIAV